MTSFAPNLVPMAVLLPLVGAGLALAARRSPRFQRGISLLMLSTVVVVAAILVNQTDSHGPQVIWIGAWPEPLGISLVADRLSSLMLLVSAVVALVVLVFAIGQGLADDEEDTPMSIFHPTYLILMAGVSNAFLAGDLFNLFVGFEILLFSSYVLLTLGGTGERIHAGTTYVVVSLVSSSLFLIAIAAAYASTGTVNLAHLALRLEGLPESTVLVVQLALLTAFGIKAAVFPMSSWLPDSYPTAPAPVTAVFAGLLTKVGVYAIIRVQTLLFPNSPLTGLLMWAALLTMIVGILGAVSQSGLKRILSFTLVSHIGYMIFGVALATPHGTAGAIFYVAHHITIQTALFLITGLVERLGRTTQLDRLGGLAKASPVLAILFFVSAMNLSGIPPLSGFLAKIGLFHAGLEVGTPLAWTLVAGGIITSLLTLYALAKVWSQAFWRPVANETDEIEETPSLADASVGGGALLTASYDDRRSTSGDAPVGAGGTLPGGNVSVGNVSVSNGSGGNDPGANDPDGNDPDGNDPDGNDSSGSPRGPALPAAMLAAAAAMTAVGLVITLIAGPMFAYTQRAATDLMRRDPYITSVLPEQVRR